MLRQKSGSVEYQVTLHVKTNREFTEPLQRFARLNRVKSIINRQRIDGSRKLAAQSHHDRAIRAMPKPRQRKRSKQLNANSRDPLRLDRLLKQLSEPAGGDHRPHSVRTARTDTNLEHIEKTDHRGSFLLLWVTVRFDYLILCSHRADDRCSNLNCVLFSYSSEILDPKFLIDGPLVLTEAVEVFIE